MRRGGVEEIQLRFGSLGRFSYPSTNDSSVSLGSNESKENTGFVGLRTRDCFFAIPRF